ncbi:MAG: Thiol:disulfide interchange protein DsbD [Candidatus Omnitrophica bacterium]|nr:Thiol:disulfide interchange protein DsbD [Candidatus Omnitrophota bacterium]
MFALPVAAAAATDAYDAHTRVTLLSENAAVRPGGTLRVAVVLEPDPDWHVYWVYPGDSGESPRVHWRLPEGWTADPKVDRPAPVLHLTPPLATSVHRGSAIWAQTLRAAPRPEPYSADLTAEVWWLACKEECLPGTATLTRSVRIDSEDLRDPEAARIIREGLKGSPDLSETIRTQVLMSPRRVELSFRPTDAMRGEGLHFFAAGPGLAEASAPQHLTERSDGTYVLSFERPMGAKATLEELKGVIGPREGATRDGQAAWIDPVAASDRSEAPAAAVLLAFIGGLLLNLMPCVLPVLSLKAIRLSRGNEPGSLIAYVIGVFLTFWSAATLIFLLKAAGREVGWGFQMQSPVFVGLLSQIFGFVGLSLFREWTPAGPVVTPGSRGHWAGVGEGVLSVAAAAPCVAPFMGSAIGYALAAGPAESFAVFGSLAAGYVTPLVLATRSPYLRTQLPKPGAWMVRLKYLLLLPVIGTVVWLMAVLSRQVTGGALALHAAVTLLAIGLAAHRPAGRTAPSKIGVPLLCALALGVLALGAIRSEGSRTAGPGGADGWRPYSKTALQNALDEGRTVFVDFTADWCLTCQLNKRLVLDTPATEKLFDRYGTVKMRADWTRHDTEIGAAIASYGRSGVPLNVVLRRGREPVLLPEILTHGALRRALHDPPAE